MTNHISLDKITTKAATEEFKEGWERIFGAKPEPKRIYCGACGIDRTDGAMCQACAAAIARKHDVKKITGDW